MAYKNKNIDIIPNDYKLNFNNVTGSFRNYPNRLEPGVSHGYIAGGFTNTAPPVPPPTSAFGSSLTSNINKFNFAAQNEALSVADLTVSRADVVGNSSPTHGYNSGGLERSPLQPFSPPTYATNTYYPNSFNTPTPNFSSPNIVQTTNIVDKHSFGTTITVVDVGDLTQGRRRSSGASSSSHGYVSGGQTVTHTFPPLITTVGNSNVIDKFPFSSDANSADVGDLTTSLTGVAGQQSSTNGYSVGGTTGQVPPVGHRNVIEKFPFASDANSTDIADLTVARSSTSGHSSSTNGYTAGGDISPVSPAPFSTSFQMSDVIDKFPFSSDDNATDVGDLSINKQASAGMSSPTAGFIAGSSNGPAAYPSSDRISNFPFATNADASAPFFNRIASPRGGGAGTQGG